MQTTTQPNTTTNNLSPTLNLVQLKQNIDALTKGGMKTPDIQNYVNNYTKGADGNYTLKGSTTTPTDNTIQPSFKADTTNGASSIIPNIARMAGNVPSDVAGTVEAGVITPAKNIGESIKTTGDIIKDRGLVKGSQDIVAGFGQTVKDMANTFITNPIEKTELINHLAPIQDQALKQRDTILQKIDDARKNGENTTNLTNALKIVQDNLNSLNSQIGSKEDRANSVLDTAQNIAKYPIEHPVQTAIAADTLPKETEQTISDTLKPVTSKIESGANAVKNTASDLAAGTKNLITKTKEAISPTLTPAEEVGKIIQGKTTDIPAAQRTFQALGTDAKTIAKMEPKELSDTIQTKLNANQTAVDARYANDITSHPMSDFEQTVGKGKNAVKTNYVQQAIDQLKDFYTKTNDAQGLSDMKALEEKANTEGLSSKELNNLAKEHGSTIKTFNQNGEAASGLSKQAAENTRSGVKTTARNMLSKTDPEGAAEVTRLDHETSDAIHTKDLVDKQVEIENKGVQKKGKPGAIHKWTKAHPITTKLIKIGAGATVGNAVGGPGGEAVGAVAGGLGF